MRALPALALVALTWSALWSTPDQAGARLFARGDFAAAAERFEDPLWKATAAYRARDFEAAQALYARLDSAEAHYGRGNCLVFLGQYDDAVQSYDRALERRPDWREAVENRELARARGERVRAEGGEAGDQKIGADEIVFDKREPGGQQTEVDAAAATGETSVQELWLRRVQTRPADFLKAKFAYQLRYGEGDE